MTPRYLLVGLLVAAALVLNWLPGLDAAAEEYLSLAISDNLVIYGTARTINGVISVIQSVELSISVFAGVAVSLGEILDPLNDLIERFSAFVLYALAGLGLQKIVLVATSSLAMKVITTIALLCGFISWIAGLRQSDWLIKIAALLVLARFFFIIEVGTIATLDKLYFDDQKASAHSALQLVRDKFRDIYPKLPGEDAKVPEIPEIKEAEAVTEKATGAIVDLITIMLIRSLLLPLLFIWCLLLAARGVVSWPRPATAALPGAGTG
jgi:hypothetical protein